MKAFRSVIRGHDYQIFIVGENNSRVPHGEVGEIASKAATINSDYSEKPRANNEKHLPIHMAETNKIPHR